MTTPHPIRLALAVAAVAAASRAEAFPAFARKYGMSCTTCHVAWPILNQQGQSFRDNGYQFGLGKDDPATLSPAHVPIAVRSTAAYEFTRSTNRPWDGGPVEVGGGGVPVPGVDVLTGGTVAKDLSFLVVVAGFVEGEPASLRKV